jgi:DNA-binding SARP family transcriptional activator
MVWLAAGAPDEAERLLRQALSGRTEDRGARLGLALAVADAGDLAASERMLRALLDEDPALAPAHLELASVLARAGRGGEAELAAQAARGLGASPSAIQAARRGGRG